MKENEAVQNLPKYAQALYSDSALYWSGENTIATSERKNIIMQDIQLLKDSIAVIEKALG